ncbi:RnfABCDGE type electron transport complex subunit D [Candidatus Gottesmanbacteria bacterium]|nr:RnfABCDGE type electron transport complex subunit D [Candidatus Gottesmanbacteria bacterium]
MLQIFNRLLHEDVRKQVALILFLIWLISIFYFKDLALFFLTPTAIITCVVTEYGLNFLFKKVRFISVSAIITGLLIGLTLYTDTSIFLVVLISALSIIFKHFIQIQGRPIFNPAALGLLFGAMVLKISPTWWGVAWNNWFWLFLLFFQGYVLKRMKRIWHPLSFLIAYALYLFLRNPGNILPLLLDSSLFLFAFVMLPEPQTAPLKGFWTYSWGPLVVVNIFLLSHLSGFVWDPLLSALVLANGESLFLRKVLHEV